LVSYYGDGDGGGFEERRKNGRGKKGGDRALGVEFANVSRSTYIDPSITMNPIQTKK
jgi:hypothetical protein